MNEVPVARAVVRQVEAAVQSGMYHNDKGEHVWHAKLTISVCPLCLAKHRFLLQGVGEDIPKLFDTECQRGGGKLEVVAYK